jgi:DNA modification methylase
LSPLQEQLRRHAFGGSATPSDRTLGEAPEGLTARERLSALLAGELNFHGEGSGYASHDLHAFAAKFPPQLPRAFIRGLTRLGDIVLDPMMGSGTTLVEALLEGRRAIGLDIDPLALRLTQAKTTPLDPERVQRAGHRVVSRAIALLSDRRKLERELASRFDKATKEFIDYWFAPRTQRELLTLLLAITEETNDPARRFLELTFSSIIVTKSGGVSRARDLAHSRPHLDTAKVPKNALQQFAVRLRRNTDSIAELKVEVPLCAALAADARRMPVADQTVSLIMTSPPYANAIDYMRAHKFSLVWFGTSIARLSCLRSEYIGAERRDGQEHAQLPDKAEAVIGQLNQRDSAKAHILRKYLCEMRSVLVEMFRVLRDDAAAILVVGSSVMRGLDVQTHYCLADIAACLGFEAVGVVPRAMDRNKRMMPARFGGKTGSLIEQRMHEEYVIGLLKPSRNPKPIGGDSSQQKDG